MSAPPSVTPLVTTFDELIREILRLRGQLLSGPEAAWAQDLAGRLSEEEARRALEAVRSFRAALETPIPEDE